eukprot:1944040-Amphidinium_carterae.1
MPIAFFDPFCTYFTYLVSPASLLSFLLAFLRPWRYAWKGSLKGSVCLGPMLTFAIGRHANSPRKGVKRSGLRGSEEEWLDQSHGHGSNDL